MGKSRKMGLIGEGFILLGGFCFILYYFFKNFYNHGYDIAKKESGFHFDGVGFLLKSFVDVFIKGKKEKDIIDH